MSIRRHDLLPPYHQSAVASAIRERTIDRVLADLINGPVEQRAAKAAELGTLVNARGSSTVAAMEAQIFEEEPGSERGRG